MFEISIGINRAPGTVFDYLADIESGPEWYSALHSVAKLSAGSIGRGARYVFTREIGRASLDNEVEVSEFEEGAVLTMTSIAGPTPFKYRYLLKAAGGNTLLHLEGSISGEGLPKHLSALAPLASHFFKQGMKSNLQTLKTIIEGRSR
jgi:hypothetical protein